MAKGTKGSKTRNLFQELSSGVQAMRDHREGRLELRSHRIEPATVYQLKVTLMETDPPIWRRLSVAGDMTLRRLDRVIQTAMGWTNSHLHTFTAGGVLYADPSPEWEIPVKDERRVRLDRIASEEGEAFVYEYDLGDSCLVTPGPSSSEPTRGPPRERRTRAGGRGRRCGLVCRGEAPPRGSSNRGGEAHSVGGSRTADLRSLG